MMTHEMIYHYDILYEKSYLECVGMSSVQR